MTYDEAEGVCREMRGNVASIRNYQQNVFVQSFIPNYNTYIGLRISKNSSGDYQYAWRDGSNVDYKNIVVNLHKKRSCAIIVKSSSEWRSVECSSKSIALCEKLESKGQLYLLVAIPSGQSTLGKFCVRRLIGRGVVCSF